MTTKKQTIEKANEPAKEVTLNSPAPAMSPAPMTMAAAPMAAPSTDATEDQLPAQNNFEFVRALDAKGESILINKADLVSVLEGLLPKQIRITHNYDSVLAPDGVGIAMAYNSANPLRYILVSFCLKKTSNIEITKLAGTLGVGQKNLFGTWVVEDADTYVVIHSHYL